MSDWIDSRETDSREDAVSDDPIAEARARVYQAIGRDDVSEEKKIQLVLKVIEQMVGSNAIALAYMGDKLGLFHALTYGPTDAQELAGRVAANPRYVREWANAMVACGFIEYDRDSGQYFLTGEQQLVFTTEGFPSSAGGILQLAVGIMRNVDRVSTHFLEGGGLPRSELPEDIVVGVERLWAGTHQQQMPLRRAGFTQFGPLPIFTPSTNAFVVRP